MSTALGSEIKCKYPFLVDLVPGESHFLKGGDRKRVSDSWYGKVERHREKYGQWKMVFEPSQNGLIVRRVR